MLFKKKLMTIFSLTLFFLILKNGNAASLKCDKFLVQVDYQAKTPVVEYVYRKGGRIMTHKTSLELVYSILKTGALLPGSQVSSKKLSKSSPLPGGWMATGEFDVVFMSLWPKRDIIMDDFYMDNNSRPNLALLVFDLDLLNRKDYYANPAFQYGNVNRGEAIFSRKSTFFPHELKELFADMKRSSGGRRDLSIGNEFCFRNKILLNGGRNYSGLKEIWVHPDMLEKAEEYLDPVLKEYSQVKLVGKLDFNVK